jgi:hypothetical protein
MRDRFAMARVADGRRMICTELHRELRTAGQNVSCPRFRPDEPGCLALRQVVFLSANPETAFLFGPGVR